MLAFPYRMISVTGVVLLCVLELLSCGGDTAKGPRTLPLGYLDSPKPAEVVRGMYRVAGWALSENGIQDVFIYLDRNFVGAALLGIGRPDLARFKNFARPEYGGFQYQWDTSTAPAGAHWLIVQAISKDGVAHDIGIVQITIAH
jgi:hypothetical protein